VTSRDVALACGVSQSTVSRVLTGDRRISPLTKAKVEKAVKELGYRPNTAARNLITRRTQTMGVVVADITNLAYPFIVNELYQVFGKLGYSALLFDQKIAGQSENPLGPFLSHSVDGLLFLSATLESGLSEATAEQRVPAVFLNRHTEDDLHDRVVSDNSSGGRAVANLLVDLGHTRIGLISGPADTSTARERDFGFTTELERRGVPLDPTLHRRGPYGHDAGLSAMRELLTHEPLPSAVFCGNDVIAFGALDAADELGFAVPGQVSVVGFDDIPIAGWRRMNLTTVRQPLPEMARTAAEMLVDRVDNLDAPTVSRVFPTNVVYRGTVGKAP
jgi:LacI family transcriptional regulator